MEEQALRLVTVVKSFRDRGERGEGERGKGGKVGREEMEANSPHF